MLHGNSHPTISHDICNDTISNNDIWVFWFDIKPRERRYQDVQVQVFRALEADGAISARFSTRFDSRLSGPGNGRRARPNARIARPANVDTPNPREPSSSHEHSTSREMFVSCNWHIKPEKYGLHNQFFLWAQEIAQPRADRHRHSLHGAGAQV